MVEEIMRKNILNQWAQCLDRRITVNVMSVMSNTLDIFKNKKGQEFCPLHPRTRYNWGSVRYIEV